MVAETSISSRNGCKHGSYWAFMSALESLALSCYFFFLSLRESLFCPVTDKETQPGDDPTSSALLRFVTFPLLFIQGFHSLYLQLPAKTELFVSSKPSIKTCSCFSLLGLPGRAVCRVVVHGPCAVLQAFDTGPNKGERGGEPGNP